MAFGRALIKKISRPMQLKCQIDNQSNGFYKHLRFAFRGNERGKVRIVKKWVLC